MRRVRHGDARRADRGISRRYSEARRVERSRILDEFVAMDNLLLARNSFTVSPGAHWVRFAKQRGPTLGVLCLTYGPGTDLGWTRPGKGRTRNLAECWINRNSTRITCGSEFDPVSEVSICGHGFGLETVILSSLLPLP